MRQEINDRSTIDGLSAVNRAEIEAHIVRARVLRSMALSAALRGIARAAVDLWVAAFGVRGKLPSGFVPLIRAKERQLASAINRAERQQRRAGR